jgi:hypothetical protein
MSAPRILLACALALLVWTPLTSQETATTENLSPELAERLGDAISSQESFETHGFLVHSAEVKEYGANLEPNGSDFQLLDVTADDLFRVVVEKGRAQSTGGGIGVFHRRSGAPLLSAGDRDGDGRIDILTYSVVDENGEHLLDVIDYDADGQADLRLNSRDASSEIWHEDRWYPVEERDGSRGIVVDGEFLEIRNIGNRPVVQ